MALKWKTVIPVVIVAVIVVLIGYSQLKTKAPSSTEPEQPQGQAADVTPPAATGGQEQVPVATPPTATGNVGDIVAALLEDSSSEALGFQKESEDINLIGNDSQAISDFGQSYDETAF